MKVIDKFKEYIKDNPESKEAFVDIANKLDVTKQTLSRSIVNAEQAGLLKRERRLSKLFLFKK